MLPTCMITSLKYLWSTVPHLYERKRICGREILPNVHAPIESANIEVEQNIDRGVFFSDRMALIDSLHHHRGLSIEQGGRRAPLLTIWIDDETRLEHLF